MTPAINGTVRCPDCGDRLPTDRPAGQVAWVTCANCGRSRQGAVQPLVRVAQAADAHRAMFDRLNGHRSPQ